MNEVFASTMHLRDSRDLLVNSERVLLVERTQHAYKILFDNGQEIELDLETGKMVCHALGEISRPRPIAPTLPNDPVRLPRQIRYRGRL